MNRHRIDAYLSPNSFQQAADAVHQYINDFKRKCEDFGLQMTFNGYNVSKIIIEGIPEEEKGDISVDIKENRSNGNFEGHIVVSGSQCVFIEFGAGVTYNPSSSGTFHPKGAQYGFEIDSYNPNGKANIKPWDGSNATNPKGWFTPDGEHTYGTHTYMPLEYGAESIINNVASIARSVFG